MEKTGTTKKDNIFPIKVDELEKILRSKFKTNPDLSFKVFEQQKKKIAVFFISYLTTPGKVEQFLLEPLLSKDIPWTNKLLLNDIPLDSGEEKTNLDDTNIPN